MLDCVWRKVKKAAPIRNMERASHITSLYLWNLGKLQKKKPASYFLFEKIKLMKPTGMDANATVLKISKST